METRAHHVLIGLFTVLSATAALLFALWLGKSSADREFQNLVVVFNEAVTGLAAGNAVQYSGIRVGDVTDLRLDPTDPRKVLVSIRVRADTPIKQDTEARLAMTGITGLAIIQLFGGSPGSPLLHANKGEGARIVATPSPLTRLMANGEDFVLGAKTLLAGTNALLSDDNVAKVSHTLTHLEQATGTLANQRDELSAMLRSMNEASQQATRALRQSSELLETSQQLAAGPGRDALESMNRSMVSLEKASQTLEALMLDNQKAMSSGMRGFAELGPTLLEMRGTMAAIRLTTRTLSEGPAGLLNREQNREFQP